MRRTRTPRSSSTGGRWAARYGWKETSNDSTSADSETYFRTRPLQSRYGAWASRQSEVIPDRESLEHRFEEAEAAFGDDVPLPGHWGGYRLRPHTIEFWQHRDNRLHDRFRYRLADDRWIVERLSP